MSMNTITVGADKSDAADNALAWAMAMAADTGATIQAAATWQMPLLCLLPGQIQGMATPEFMADQTAKSLNDIVERVTSRNATDVTVDNVVVEGKPGPTLVEVAAQSDLLVVGRTGFGRRRGVSRAAEVILGSTARHCIHHATTPVATVPSAARWSTQPTVVVGVDGSPASLAALDWALTALPQNSKVHVVRAFEPWVGDGLIPQDLIGEEAIDRAVRKETQAWVDAAIARTQSAISPPTTETHIATAQHALLEPGYDADLIVCGQRGISGVTSMVLGSVSDYLVRYSTCPVIVVPR